MHLDNIHIKWNIVQFIFSISDQPHIFHSFHLINIKMGIHTIEHFVVTKLRNTNKRKPLPAIKLEDMVKIPKNQNVGKGKTKT